MADSCHLENGKIATAQVTAAKFGTITHFDHLHPMDH